MLNKIKRFKLLKALTRINNAIMLIMVMPAFLWFLVSLTLISKSGSVTLFVKRLARLVDHLHFAVKNWMAEAEAEKKDKTNSL